MNRNELEHIIRAAGEIARVRILIILGSQSVLGQFPDLAESLPKSDHSEISFVSQKRQVLCRSVEADIMVPESEEKAELIEAVIGELSSFHDTFGYYAQGVDHTTSKLPEGWETRLIEICNRNTNDISGMCLEIHDLIISKLYAARKKDMEFFQAAVSIGLISKEILAERLDKTQMSEEKRGLIKNNIEKGFSQ
ncbi:MAG: DUF6036 family nucleotidyltransferase [Pseudomonadota bacterium]